MTKSLAVLCAALLAASVSVHAEEWTTMGPRAMGMGGAGVALSQGPLASYWNPAALGRATENSYGFQVPGGVHGAVTGDMVAGAKDLQTIQSDCSSTPVGPNCTQANINKAIGELGNPNDGLRMDGGLGGDFKVGKIAVFANGFLNIGATPRVDTTHTSTAGGANNISNNTSSLIVKGARILEVGAGYGHELPFAPGLFVGGDVKWMRALVGFAGYGVVQNTNNSGKSDIINTLKNNETNSSNIGVDAGALWEVDRTFDNAPWSPKVGLTGRNLNNPKFSQPTLSPAFGGGGGGKYAVNPQARLGVAISPLHFWNLAADVDLTNNITPVDNVKSRQLGIGTEINVFNRSWINIPIRFGLARNLSGATNMLTAGAGLNFLHLMIDFAGEASGKSIDTQTTGSSSKIPQEFGASVQLSLLFGGSEEERGATRTHDTQPVPTEKAMQPASTNEVTPDQVKQNADKAQQELNNQSAPAKK